MTSRIQNGRARTIAGNALMYVSGIAVLLSETMKFLEVPAVVREMARAGFVGDKLLLVATLGSASAILFLYPRTRAIGLLLLSSFLGGAICVHLQQNKFVAVLAPSFLLDLAWIGTFLRHPEILWGFGKPDIQTSRSSRNRWTSTEAL